MLGGQEGQRQGCQAGATGVPGCGVGSFGVFVFCFSPADPQVLAVARIAAKDDLVPLIAATESGS